MTEKLLPAGVTWDAVVEELGRIVSAQIAAAGSFNVMTATGVFICG